MIKYDVYPHFCDYVFDKPETENKYPNMKVVTTPPNENCVVYVPMDWIHAFFQLCADKPFKYVVVSANSDYGVEYQANSPVSEDMWKWIRFIGPEDLGYRDLNVAARCDIQLCKKTDKYSIKVYSYTKATFHKIPHNVVKWFATNADIEHPKVVNIPFGIPHWTYDIIERKRDWVPSFHNKKNKIYVNFQPNTIERLSLLRTLDGQQGFHVESEWPLDKDKYIDKMAEFKFVLSPTGNGLDCFRTWEALALGCVPVVFDGNWSDSWTDMPIVRIKTMDDLNISRLLSNIPASPTFDKSTDHYWEERIQKEKEKI